ncbi:MAG: hypothetical protein ACXU8R_18705, partial [Xanthobacteraceae bacterium]
FRPGQHVGRRGGSASMRFGIFQCRIHLSCELLAALRTSYRRRMPKLGEPEGEPSRTLFRSGICTPSRTRVMQHAGRFADNQRCGGNRNGDKRRTQKSGHTL